MARNHHHHNHQQQQKHLYELLQDDQEPFILNNYIADVHRRCQLTKAQPKRTTSNFARSACFFSSDPRKSPLHFPKSPVGKTTLAAAGGGSFGRVPSKTASLLLEAAIRVSHKTQGRGGNNNKKGTGKIGAGIFGSLLKRLGNSKKPKKEGVNGVNYKVSVKDILRQDLNGGSGRNRRRAKSGSQLRNGGCESEPSSSAVWSSESNESIDLDLECRSSSSGAAGLSDEELEFVTKVVYHDDGDDKQYFCESPFHFVLESSSSSSAGRPTPEFSSPVASPICLKTEGNDSNNDVESLKKCQVQKQGDVVEEEEEKEQCSPVSVLDPPFEDDDDDCDEEDDEDGDDEEDDDEGFDMECSFAFVQKAKQQLLQKLRRFEKLAELDPVELEKRMLEYDDEEYDNNDDDNDYGASDECDTADDNNNNDCIDQNFIMDELRKSSIEIPKRLVSDLIDEEEKQGNGSIISTIGKGECATKRVCKRFEAWNEVESNTIEMMVEHDFNRSHDEWRHNEGGQVSDIAREIELAIFELLAEELV